MRWPVFLILAYLALALDGGLRGLWVYHGTWPELPLILLVFIALSAPARHVAWSALLLGLLVDLQPIAVHLPSDRSSAADLVLVGPNALGYMLAGFAAYQFRGFAFRDSPITVAVAALFSGVFAHLVVVALLSFRGFSWLTAEPIPDYSAAADLVARALRLLYTAVVALPVGWLLIRSDPLWGFPLIKGTAYRRPG